MIRNLLFIALFLSHFSNGYGQTVETIHFEGATKTDTNYLAALIDCKVGTELDSTILANDLQTLKNLNLFFSVDHSVKIDPAGNAHLVFIIEEAVYLYPIVSISGFKDQFKFQAGANQINFLGKAQSIGFLYQYYDRHSLAVFYTAPKHANGKTGHEVALAKYSTIEPLYFMDTVASFNFDNYSVSLGGFYWLGKKLRLGLGGMYMWEKYEQLDNADIGYIQNEFSFNKYQIRFRTDYEGINQHYEFREGISAAFFSEMIHTEGMPEASFLKATTRFKYFKRLGKRGNFGIQNQLGISTNNDSPFAPFVLDGFINVRGVGNRVERGTAEFIINAEYLHTVLKKKYFIAQVAAFSDYGALRTPGASIASIFKEQKTNLYGGIGIRLHSRFIYKTIFRLDLSTKIIQNDKKVAFTFGLGQFF
ncbi:MAG: BamA/TamA family outer membrane protein [Crocinitomix sp.]|nr:BamA/TamA family outer membrane protein [Crocinitomix sp.]